MQGRGPRSSTPADAFPGLCGPITPPRRAIGSATTAPRRCRWSRNAARVTGSIKRSSAASRSGCLSVSALRPPPARRTRSTSRSSASSSARPARIVVRLRPVALETVESPPYPSARDSVAAQRRRLRSSRRGLMASNFLRIMASAWTLRFMRGKITRRGERATRNCGQVDQVVLGQSLRCRGDADRRASHALRATGHQREVGL